MVRHLEVIIDEVDDEVGEPGVLAVLRLEQSAEEAQALLTESVAEELEAHQSLVLSQALCEESKSQVLNVIVCHVEVD